MITKGLFPFLPQAPILSNPVSLAPLGKADISSHLTIPGEASAGTSGRFLPTLLHPDLLLN